MSSALKRSIRTIGQDGVQRRFLPIPFTQVSISDRFWANRQRINREDTIPHIYEQLIKTDRIAAFRPDWNPDDSIRHHDRWGSVVMFGDSDVAKWLEAVSYSLATNPDPALEELLDQVIELIGQAQHADGYLNTWFTTIEPQHRWKNLRDWHELYCAGHLIEAAVAHYEATGKRSLLDILCRYTDHIARMFGPLPDQRPGYCGHPEIELALVRLAQATGEQRYMELSRYFVDERGRKPHYYDREARERGENPEAFWSRTYEYNQSHLPVREQPEVVGHAVRAVYLYSAMIDLAGEYQDPSLLESCQRLWTHLTTKRMYVMGGIGTSRQNEGFTSDYDLPNESAYAETCAAIGLVFWAQRMLQYSLDRRYSDTLELALYNAVISGVSLDGRHFFYDNPLASHGSHHRVPWFHCPCCPPNIARLLASLGNYIYAQSATDLVVHLYIQGSGTFQFHGEPVVLHQETNYPWDGAVALRIETAGPIRFGFYLRIPGWCDTPTLVVNGEVIDLAGCVKQGYAYIEREWSNSDLVQLNLPMAIQQLYAHPAVVADIGQVALQRGPLIFCFEQADHAVPLDQIVLLAGAELVEQFEPELFDGVITLRGNAIALHNAGWEGCLYRSTPPTTEHCPVTAIPYYAWDHRAAGRMRVWMREI